MENIEIGLSKTKLILMFLASLAFVTLGIQFTIHPENYISFRYSSPELIKIVGIITILFFPLGIIYSLVKIFDKKKGLIIDKNGITDNSSGYSNGLIVWKDIISINVTKVKSTSFLLIIVKNPVEYIGKANYIKALVMKLNYKLYGTPISISSTSLKIDFEDLRNIVETEFQKSKL